MTAKIFYRRKLFVCIFFALCSEYIYDMLLENINKEKICDDFIYPKENNDDTNEISRIGLGGYVLPIDDHDLSVEIVNKNKILLGKEHLLTSLTRMLI